MKAAMEKSIIGINIIICLLSLMFPSIACVPEQ
jgi:hypothetical protein